MFKVEYSFWQDFSLQDDMKLLYANQLLNYEIILKYKPHLCCSPISVIQKVLTCKKIICGETLYDLL